MDRPANMWSNSSYSFDSLPGDHRGKDLLVVDSMFLLKIPSDETHLIPHQRTIKSLFQFKNPSRCYRSFTWRQWNKGPCVVIVYGLKFWSHGALPVRNGGGLPKKNRLAFHDACKWLGGSAKVIKLGRRSAIVVVGVRRGWWNRKRRRGGDTLLCRCRWGGWISRMRGREGGIWLS